MPNQRCRLLKKTLEGASSCCDHTNPCTGHGRIQLKVLPVPSSRPACFYSPQEQIAERGTKVLIIVIKERICYVMPYESYDKAKRSVC